MEEDIVRMAAKMHALVADMEAVKTKIKAMERRNELRDIGFDELHFFNAQIELEEIAEKLREI